MTADIRQYGRKKNYYLHIDAESVLHMSRSDRSWEIAPSDLSTALECTEEVESLCIVVQTPIEGGNSTARLISNSSLHIAEDTHHHFVELPVHLSISPLTKSCTILSNKDGFYFDLEDMENGKLYISERRDGAEDGKSRWVNTGDLMSKSSICIRPEPNSRNLVFDIINTLHTGVRVDIIWEDLSGT
jgi:hypothetical protein